MEIKIDIKADVKLNKKKVIFGIIIFCILFYILFPKYELRGDRILNRITGTYKDISIIL